MRTTFLPILIYFELLAIVYKFSKISVHNFVNMQVETVCSNGKIRHQCKSMLNFRKFSLISPSPSKFKSLTGSKFCNCVTRKRQYLQVRGRRRLNEKTDCDKKFPINWAQIGDI